MSKKEDMPEKVEKENREMEEEVWYQITQIIQTNNDQSLISDQSDNLLEILNSLKEIGNNVTSDLMINNFDRHIWN